MLTRIFVAVSLISLCLYLYGILITITVVEPNVCKMTYMFEYPQFVKISFKENDQFPKYNLYAYSEGHLTENSRNMIFNGAPVIFVPGNGGSYKQARSFASVALRKGIENKWLQHLDYFSVDFNSEFSGLYGGVLQEQSDFLAICIKTVLRLYKHKENRPRNVVIIGHSMGGKIAQSILINDTIIDMVNTIITFASPLDKPVINIDFYFESFYRNIENFWTTHRNIPSENIVTNLTNVCDKCYKSIENEKNLLTGKTTVSTSTLSLNNQLLITIGGGSRDILINSGLTTSRYSDVHAMSTSIPNVWLTTDHLCAVWCLQQVKVINKFLYSIIETPSTTSSRAQAYGFIEDKQIRLQKAKQYITQDEAISNKFQPVKLVNDDNYDLGDWIEDSRRVFFEQFKMGYNRTRYQMIRFNEMQQHEILYVQMINVDLDDWLFGCSATDTNKFMRYCSQAISLRHYTRKLPSKLYPRRESLLNLRELQKLYPSWTHVIVKTIPSKEPFQLNIDVHGSGDRQLSVMMPKWYSFSQMNLLDDTILGASTYTISVTGMEETYHTMELNIISRSCPSLNHLSVAKLCVPWAKGFERYHYFSYGETSTMYIYTPILKPIGYNTTSNPIKIELSLDPECRYSINMKHSFGMSYARMAQHYSHWLPAHITAILLLALKHQLSLSPKNEPFKCGSLYSALYKCSPFFLITGSRLFANVIMWFKGLPIPDDFDRSILISIIIHGSSLAILSFATTLLWFAITICGTILHKILFNYIKLPVPPISSLLIPVIQKFPLSIAILLIAMIYGSCGGLGLVCAVFVYFILIVKLYEDYLEVFVYDTAKLIANKLFGRSMAEQDTGTVGDTSILESDVNKNDDSKNEEKIENVEVIKNTGKEILKKSDDIALDKSTELSTEETNNSIETEDNQLMKNEDGVYDEKLLDAELDKLLKESLETQKTDKLKQDKELKQKRAEYDSIPIGLSSLNFHLSLFILLVILATLNLPTVITWANNFSYTKVLKPDPSLIPSVVLLVAVSIIWQMPTPLNVHGYPVISNILYICSMICILYCRDSVYRLNAVIIAVFIFIATHQLFSSKFQRIIDTEKDSPESLEIKRRIEELREEFSRADIEGENITEQSPNGEASESRKDK